MSNVVRKENPMDEMQEAISDLCDKILELEDKVQEYKENFKLMAGIDFLHWMARKAKE